MNGSPCKKPMNKDIKQMAQELEDEEAQKVLSNDNIKIECHFSINPLNQALRKLTVNDVE